EGPFQMLVTTIERNPFLGRILTGRVFSGSVKPGDAVHALSRDGKVVEKGRISKVLGFRGLEREPIEEGRAGDIVALAGLETATVANTIAVPQVSEALDAKPIDPPTLSVTFRINDGPLAGREGDKVQSRVIRERLLREAEGNIAIRLTQGGDVDGCDGPGRGEHRLGDMGGAGRRAGFGPGHGGGKLEFRKRSGGRVSGVQEVVPDVEGGY